MFQEWVLHLAEYYRTINWLISNVQSQYIACLYYRGFSTRFYWLLFDIWSRMFNNKRLISIVGTPCMETRLFFFETHCICDLTCVAKTTVLTISIHEYFFVDAAFFFRELSRETNSIWGLITWRNFYRDVVSAQVLNFEKRKIIWIRNIHFFNLDVVLLSFLYWTEISARVGISPCN